MRVKFWADSEPSMAQAMVVTLETARRTNKEFSFGPRPLERLMREGLTLSGDVPDSLVDALAAIPGLTEDFSLDDPDRR